MTTPLTSNTVASSTHGHGTAMLMIHGVGMNANYWSNLLPALYTHFCATTIDMPGHGDSPAPEVHKPSLQHYTDIISRTIESPAIVVGHSMGAMIALDLAVRYPQKISGIAVLNGIYRRDDAAKQLILARVEQLDTGMQTDHTATLERWFGQSPAGIAAAARARCNAWLKQINPQHYQSAYRAFAQAEAPDDQSLASIQCPALFMTGSLEPNSTPAMSQAMSRLVPQAECRIIDEARHMMSLTHGSIIADALIDFFGAETNA